METTQTITAPNEKNGPDYHVVRWYALTHLEPDKLKLKLDQINEQLKREGSSTFFDYFIPYSFLGQRSMPDEQSAEYKGSFTEQDVRQNNQIRHTLHRFVFIKATGYEVLRLLKSDWNKNSPKRLQPYCATSMNMKYVADNMMDSFISACYDQREIFELTPYVENVGIGAEVVIKEGKFKSAKAKVRDIYVKKDKGLCLTLSVELFARSVDITLYDYRAEDVVMSAEDTKFINAGYADYIEGMLLDILSRRVNHIETEESHQADLQTLSKVWRYRPTEVDGWYMQARILAFSLICARLRFDTTAQQSLLPEARNVLTQLSEKPPTQRNALARAILHISLFIATKDPSHRAQAKELVYQFTEKNHSLRRFISLIRR